MGSGPSSSSSKATAVGGQTDSKSPRKFQSYHLPFVNQKQKGFSKLRKVLSRQKKSKPKLNRYDHALALLSSSEAGKTTSAGVYTSGGDGGSKVLSDLMNSEYHRPDVQGLDYQLYYHSFGASPSVPSSLPYHMSVGEGIGQLRSAVAGGGEMCDIDLRDECDTLSLPDEQLMSGASAVHDAYSEVIKRVLEAKSSSGGDGGSVPQLSTRFQEDSSEEKLPVLDSGTAEVASSVEAGVDGNHEMGNQNSVQQEREVESDRVQVKATLPVVQYVPQKQDLLSATLRLTNDKANESLVVRHAEVASSEPSPPVDRDVEHPCLPVTSSGDMGSAERHEMIEPPVMPATAIVVVEDSRTRETATSLSSSAAAPVNVEELLLGHHDVVIDHRPSYPLTAVCPVGDCEAEGEALLLDIALKEEHLCKKLDEVKSSLATATSVRSQDNGSSDERSGSLGEEDVAVCGDSQSSDVAVSGMSSVDSLWEEIKDDAGCVMPIDVVVSDRSPVFGSAVQKEDSSAAPDNDGGTALPPSKQLHVAKSPVPEVLGGIGAADEADLIDFAHDRSGDVIFSASEANLVIPSPGDRLSGGGNSNSSQAFGSDFRDGGGAVRHYSPSRSSSASSDGGRYSASSSRASLEVPRLACQIRSKLIDDLLSKLEVDLGDFQAFLGVNASLEGKYEVFPAKSYLQNNLQVGIDELSRSLRLFAKYALNLLKPEAERPKYWKKIVVMSDVDSTPHWMSVAGAKEILLELGYREDVLGFAYDDNSNVDATTIAAWVIEMLLAAYELNAYSLGSHPMAHIFREAREKPPTTVPATIHDDDSNVDGDFELVQAEDLVEDHIYANACDPQLSGGDTEPASMFGRRTVVPWLSEKENRIAKDAVQCGLCGSSSPAVSCEKCSNLSFCLSCDDMYHRHPKRLGHVRKVVNAPPPPPPRPPPKPTDPNKIPVPPPRRRKSQHSPSPGLESSPGFELLVQQQKPELPKKQFPLKFGSLRRFMPSGGAAAGRSLPVSPKEPQLQQPRPFHLPPPSPVTGSWTHSDKPPLVGSYPNFQAGEISADGSSLPSFSQPPSKQVAHHQRPPGHGQNGGRFNNYYDRMSGLADPSSSDDDERLSGRGSSGHRHSSSGHGDEWLAPPPPPPPSLFPYDGGVEHGDAYPPNLAYHHHNQATLGRRNTVMGGAVGRSSPFQFGMRRHQQRHSNSVWDLSHPQHLMHPSAFAGYPLPQVQSLADLHCGGVEGGGGGLAAAPCGCRPSWTGPDSFGMWHPPVRCVMHSSTASLYPGAAADPMLKYVAGPQFGAYPHPPPSLESHQMHPGMYHPMMAAAAPQAPIPPVLPPPQSLPHQPSVHSSVAPDDDRDVSPLPPAERPASSVSTARPGGGDSRPRKSSRSTSKDAGVGGGGARSVRSRHNKAAAFGGTSSEEDYYSADTSDDDDDGEVATGRASGVRVASPKVERSSWECEHCTFVNPGDTRICQVCCKTTSRGRRGDGGKKKSKSVKSYKDDGVYEDVVSEVKSVTDSAPDTEVKVVTAATLEEKKKKNLAISDSTKKVKKLEEEESVPRCSVGKSEKEEVVAVERLPSPRPQKLLSESPAAAAVGCDTKGDGTVKKNVEVFRGGRVESKTVTSTGTSPPPQSISTQTPNDPVWNNSDSVPSSAVRLGQSGNGRRTSSRLSLSEDVQDMMMAAERFPSSSVLKRATSLHFNSRNNDLPWSGGGGGGGGGSLYRSGSRTSLVSDHPFGYSSGPPSRDTSPPPRSFLSRRDSERSYPSYSRFGHHEDRALLSQNGNRKDYYLSLEELVERRRQETMRTQGLKLVRMLREAELHNFNADDLQVAMTHCGSLEDPVQWLQDNWKNMVDTVVTLATNYGHDKQDNDVGIVSSSEAKEALRIHKGNIWAAVTECVEQRQKKFQELQTRGNFSKEEVVAALTSNQGIVEAAMNDLNKSTLKPFLMRIWGPPVGADNEAGVVARSHAIVSQGGDLDLRKSATRDLYEELSRDDNDEMLFLSSNGNLEDILDQLEGEASSGMMCEDDDDEIGSKETDRSPTVELSRPDSLREEVYYDAVPGSPLYEGRDASATPAAAVTEPPASTTAVGAESDKLTAPEERLPESVATLEKSPEDDKPNSSTAAVSREEPATTVASSELNSAAAPSEELATTTVAPPPEVEPDSPAPPSAGLADAESGTKEEEPVDEVPSKKRLVRRALVKKKARPVDSEFDRKVRKILAEGRIATYEKAEVAVKLIDLTFEEDEAIYAANECSSLYMAVGYLQQDCHLCTGKFPMGKMISMLYCTHRCCWNCARNYFTLKIKERNIVEAICPFCDQPDLSDESVATEYFNNLDILLKTIVDPDVHELFQCKLRDRALMSDPLFHWCAKCASGYIVEPNRKTLVCPDCRTATCALCQKPWEIQHDGVSCEQFAKWKEANDPEYQAVGLEKYLAENGIDCPKCKVKYALAKGGCMHFICSQCRFEFCSGCGRPFRHPKNCKVSANCEKLGLHAHHPRNCLFYLRDKEPEELQRLLDDSDVGYDRDVVRPSSEESSSGGDPRRCTVVEQKELPDGNEDAICGREIVEGHAGLCRVHYVEYLGGLVFRHNVETIGLLDEDDLEAVARSAGRRLPPRSYPYDNDAYLKALKEYLVSLVNKHNVDPVYMMDTAGLQQELRRWNKAVPVQGPCETEDIYQESLVKLILKEIPLLEA